MCGISGFWGEPDANLLRSMTEVLRHRGPDDDGYLEFPEASLGFRRLSIIDLSHGHQPMSTPDGKVTLVYNGEVYNFRELRDELSNLGYKFQTQSDTEVVLNAFLAYGHECFNRFNGMWALAILDKRTNVSSLTLCRDHFGIKPLYYTPNHNRILFSSEIKAILQDRSFERVPDEQMLFEYLSAGLYDHTSDTFFKGIKKVPEATYIIIRANKSIEKFKYWHPDLKSKYNANPEEFRRKFYRAVERRLVSDVPVGSCLSGGLDSSSIVGCIKDLIKNKSPDTKSLGKFLKTFSAVFEGDPIDETPYIKDVLAGLSADPHFIRPTSDVWWEELSRWVWHMEEPTITTAPYAIWSVMKEASGKVKVLLDGQAGDELLAGYVPYQYVYLRQLIKEKNYKKFIHEAWLARDVLLPIIRRRLKEQRKKVIVKDLINPSFSKDMDRPQDDRVNDDLKKRLFQDVTKYSLPSLLRYEDKNSMAHSIESRLPFLDQELVEYIFALPEDAIIRDGWSRWILRESLKSYLPEKIAKRRKKIGFTTPDFRWYRQQRSRIQSLLQSPSFYFRHYWIAPKIWQNFRKACQGYIEESGLFWRAINTEIWLRTFFDDSGDILKGPVPYAHVRTGDLLVEKITNNKEVSALLSWARPNEGKHIFVTTSEGHVYARIPLKADKTVERSDDIFEVLKNTINTHPEIRVKEGDIFFVSEKVIAITQGRSYPIEEIRASTSAKLLSRFVRRVPFGIGLGHPATMQLAIEEAGIIRIIFAALCAAVTRPFGIRGVFYKVAGARINGIDGPTAYTMPPYNTHASKAPERPQKEATSLCNRLKAVFGAGDVVIIDANDIGVNVLGTTSKIATSELEEIFLDNPLGQGAEGTPFALVRPIDFL
jgi:asparagine synthase (glutamine-hydrolysing)